MIIINLRSKILIHAVMFLWLVWGATTYDYTKVLDHDTSKHFPLNYKQLALHH